MGDDDAENLNADLPYEAQQVPTGILISDGRSRASGPRMSSMPGSSGGSRSIRFKGNDDFDSDESSDDSDPELRRIKKRISPKGKRISQASAVGGGGTGGDQQPGQQQTPPPRTGTLRNREKLRPPKYHLLDGGDFEDVDNIELDQGFQNA